MLVVHARSSSPARPVNGAQRGWEVAKRRISNDADGLRRLLDLLTEAGDTARAEAKSLRDLVGVQRAVWVTGVIAERGGDVRVAGQS